MFDDHTKPGDQLLRDAGIRVTLPRLAVLSAMAKGNAHQSVDQIVTTVRASQGSISVQAVYDNLHLLVDHNLIRRIDTAGRAAYYELRVGDNHHHLICRTCGAVRDIDCAVGFTPCLTPSESFDFEVDEAEVTFWGKCPACRNAPASHAQPKEEDR